MWVFVESVFDTFTGVKGEGGGLGENPGDVAHPLAEFYDILGELEGLLGRRVLGECSGRLPWPARGVYFFFEPGEFRSASGSGGRVVRVGTHAVASTSKATFWSRLRTHLGTDEGLGNHRGSVFRKLVGQAWMRREGLDLPTWGVGSSASAEVRLGEAGLERTVSRWLAGTSLVWLPVDDPPGPRSLRALVERNSIAMLSNGLRPLDRPSPGWLGRSCPQELVQASGLWNVNHVLDPVEPDFLPRFRRALPTAYAAAAEKASLVAERPRAEVLMDRLRRETRAGDVVRTLSRGKPNTIVSVDEEKLMVRTETGEGPQEVKWSWVRAAVEEYCRRGSLTHDQVPGRGRYRSALLLALLAAKLEDFP